MMKIACCLLGVILGLCLMNYFWWVSGHDFPSERGGVATMYSFLTLMTGFMGGTMAYGIVECSEIGRRTECFESRIARQLRDK